jgi:hypothetical protein
VFSFFCLSFMISNSIMLSSTSSSDMMINENLWLLQLETMTRMNEFFFELYFLLRLFIHVFHNIKL